MGLLGGGGTPAAAVTETSGTSPAVGIGGDWPADGEDVVVLADLPGPGESRQALGFLVRTKLGTKVVQLGSSMAPTVKVPKLVYERVTRVKATALANTDGSVAAAWSEIPEQIPDDLGIQVKAMESLFQAFKGSKEAAEIEVPGKGAERDVASAEVMVWEAFASDPAGFRHAMEEPDLGRRLQLAETRMRRTIAADATRDLGQRVLWAPLPAGVRKVVDREWRQFETSGKPANAGTGEKERIERWLGKVLELPWAERFHAPGHGLDEARRRLDAGHFGMEEPKRRMEDLVTDVLWWEERSRSHPRFFGSKPPQTQMLLFVGPFGTGKTTFARSLAAALDRPFGLVDCSGLEDVHSLKGHGRTYVDSQPGAIAREVVAMGSTKGVLCFDEVDKMPQEPGRAGNLMAVLMEVTDREKNHNFRDEYLQGIPIDLSNMQIVLTANDITRVHPGLLNRCTVIEVRGYSPHEKVTIARDYLLPRIREDRQLLPEEFDVSDDAITRVVERHTAESGVRQLSDQLRTMASRMKRRPELTGRSLQPEHVDELLDEGSLELDHLPLAVPGSNRALYVGETGGGLMGIEVNLVPAKRPAAEAVVTGTVKEMPVEMLKVASSWAKLHLNSWWRAQGRRALPVGRLDTHTIHMHWDRTGMPKDGPSAGVGTLMALVSALSGSVIPPDVAMTGEINLEGRVMAVGGVPEKVLAAHRHGMRTVLIPRENARDIAKVPADVRSEVEIVPIGHVGEALEVCFGRHLEARAPAQDLGIAS